MVTIKGGGELLLEDGIKYPLTIFIFFVWDNIGYLDRSIMCYNFCILAQRGIIIHIYHRFQSLWREFSVNLVTCTVSHIVCICV